MCLDKLREEKTSLILGAYNSDGNGNVTGGEIRVKEKCKEWCGGYGCLSHHRNLSFNEDNSNCTGKSKLRIDGDLMGTQPFINDPDYPKLLKQDLISEPRIEAGECRNLMTRQEELIRFLLGESKLDGYNFGDRHFDKGAYWWRKQLREAFKDLIIRK